MSDGYKDKLSLLIVTWDDDSGRGDSMLKNCLTTLRAAMGELPETIVVDNAAKETTKTIVAGFANSQYLSSPENLGFAGGNNLGLPYCHGKYVVLLNNDLEFQDNPFPSIVQFADENPRLGAAQGRIVRAKDPTRLDYCGFQLSPIGQIAAVGLGESVDDDRFSHPLQIYSANGAFLLVRREAIDAIGGEMFRSVFKSYYEDVDLGMRLRMCGYEVWYYPTPIVLHYGSQTAAKFSSRSIAEQGYCNRWYSLLMSYRFLGIVYLAPQLLALFFGHAIVSLLRGNVSPLRTQLRVLRTVFVNRCVIISERKRFLPLRKSSDLAFLRHNITRQPWSFYLKLLGA